jgi:hypothetical protein
MNMDTKAPTTPPNITLDHPYHDLQITMLQLTEQVKQLQRGLGMQTNLPKSRQSSTIEPISENKILTMDMDTKALPPTTSTNITLDHPSHDLQTTVLQLTEQVKQLQRELGVQIGKFNERVRPLETYLKNEEKKKQRLEEARRGLWRCGTGDIIREQNRKREKENQERGGVEWAFLMGGGAKREVRKKNNTTVGLDAERPSVWIDMGMKDIEGNQGVDEPSRGGRVSGSCQALREALEKQK